jgi:hypothetical protein
MVLRPSLVKLLLYKVYKVEKITSTYNININIDTLLLTSRSF